MPLKTDTHSSAAPAMRDRDAARTLVGAAIACALCFFAFEFVINPACAYEAQQPVFFTTAEFLANHLGVPGGLATYLGLLLSQSWYVRLVGSVVSAAVLLLIVGGMSLVLRIISRRFRPVLSLLPVLPLIAMHCSYYHRMTIDIIVLLTLVGASGYSGLHALSRLRKLSAWLLLYLTVFYATASVGAVLFVIFSATLELCRLGRKGWVEAILQILLGTILLWLAYFYDIVRSPVSEFLAFFAMPSVYQIPPIVLAALIGLSPLIALVPGRIPPRVRSLKQSAFRYGAAFLLLLGIGAAGVEFCLDRSVGRHFAYDRLAQEGKWSEILDETRKHHTEQDRPVSYEAFYGIRAMYHTGKLLTMLISLHPESPLEYLAFPPSEDGETSIANGDLYFEMGAINHAIRFASEAMAVYGYSPRLLERLALCYAAQGKTEIARSMTALLENTIVGRSFAQSFAPLLDNPQALAQHEDIRRLRLLQPKAEFMFQLTSLPYEFRHIWLGGTAFNKMAMEYFLASAPQMIPDYLNFMALAIQCQAGDTDSCAKCESVFGRSFWFNHFIHSPQLFDLARPSSANRKAVL